MLFHEAPLICEVYYNFFLEECGWARKVLLYALSVVLPCMQSAFNAVFYFSYDGYIQG